MEIAASQSAFVADSSAEASWVLRATEEGRYLRTRDWTSGFLPSPRDLFVYLPQGYLSQPDRSFPLLLLHDGQNLFDGELSYVPGSTWRVGITADQAIAEGRVAPLVIVGIANTGAERIAEYTPTADLRLGGGKGRLYARMLVEELLPKLRADYRLLTGPEHNGVAGSSLGGLLSLAIGIRFPDQFGQIGALSPSVWWDDRAILRDVRSLEDHMPLRIWLDMGTAEGVRHLRDTDLLAQLLQAKGWQQGEDLMYRKLPGGLHDEAAWAARFADVLQFLFPAE